VLSQRVQLSRGDLVALDQIGLGEIGAHIFHERCAALSI
jgi:hypothetical protein